MHIFSRWTWLCRLSLMYTNSAMTFLMKGFFFSVFNLLNSVQYLGRELCIFISFVFKMKLAWGQWLEKHCVQSALPLPLGCTVWVLSLKFCQCLQDCGCVWWGGRQLHVPAVLPLLLLEESNSLPANKSGAGSGTATSLLVRAKGHKSSSGTLEQILYFAADFLEEEYKVEPINAYY